MKFDPIYLNLYSASTSQATLPGFRGEDWGFVGIRAFVGGGGGAFQPCFRGEGFGVEAFELSWRGFRAFVRRASGFGGEAFRGVGRILGFRERFVLSCGVWGLWGGFGLSCFRGASGFRGEDLGFRGDLRFRGGVELSWGGIPDFRIGFTNLRLRAAPLKRIDFANRIDFTRLVLRAAPLKKELSWAPSCAGEP